MDRDATCGHSPGMKVRQRATVLFILVWRMQMSDRDIEPVKSRSVLSAIPGPRKSKLRESVQSRTRLP